MRQLLAALTAVAGGCLFAVAGAVSAAMDISIQPPLSQAQVGDTVAISARVAGPDSIGWFYVRILADETILTYLSCSPGITTACPHQSQCMECGPSGEPGIVSVTCACLGTGSCVAPGDLVTIIYVAAAEGISPVEFDLAAVSDCSRVMIPIGAIEGGEVIVGPASVATGDPAWNCEVTSFSCCPNPFTGGAVLQYCVTDLGARPGASGGDSEISIYDCRGRLVRRIPASLSAGEHSAAWDGDDGMAQSVSPGTYFCRFPASAGTRTYKIVKAD